MRRAVALAAVVSAATVGAAGAVGAGAAGVVAPRASLPDIEKQVMCPICGTTLELSSSPQADRERALIRSLIAQGKTTQQIKDELVAEYGVAVLAVPRASGFNLSAWVVPIVGLVLAIVGIGTAMWRWRRRGKDEPVDAKPPGGEAAERLDADLARYDL